MSQNIQVNEQQLLAAIAAAKEAIGETRPARLVLRAPGTGSVALDAFIDRFCKLEDAMDLYRKLVYQDLDKVENAKDTFFSTDKKLARKVGKIG